MKNRRKGLMIGLLSLVIITLITVIGEEMYMSNKEKENLANQRLAALTLKKEEPNATKVVFTTEGHYPGIGVPWSVQAKVTIDKEVFNMFLNKNEVMGAVFEDDNEAKKFSNRNRRKPATEKTLGVIYSNGEQEVIR